MNGTLWMVCSVTPISMDKRISWDIEANLHQTLYDKQTVKNYVSRKVLIEFYSESSADHSAKYKPSIWTTSTMNTSPPSYRLPLRQELTLVVISHTHMLYSYQQIVDLCALGLPPRKKKTALVKQGVCDVVKMMLDWCLFLCTISEAQWKRDFSVCGFVTWWANCRWWPFEEKWTAPHGSYGRLL